MSWSEIAALTGGGITFIIALSLFFFGRRYQKVKNDNKILQNSVYRYEQDIENLKVYVSKQNDIDRKYDKLLSKLQQKGRNDNKVSNASPPSDSSKDIQFDRE